VSQHDFNIANQTAPSFRTDLNNALQALATLSSGASAPSTTFANMLWYDTTNNILKMRSEADDAWISIGYLDQSVNAFRILDDTQVTNTSGTQTGLLGDQTTATWEAGTGTTESLVSPAKVKAAIEALGFVLEQVASGGFTHSTIYQNTRGVPIGIVFAAGGSNRAIQIADNSGMTSALTVGNTGDYISTHFFIVPDTWYWRINGAPIALGTIYEVY
jgi:hypothetical protein